MDILKAKDALSIARAAQKEVRDRQFEVAMNDIQVRILEGAKRVMMVVHLLC